MNDVSTLSTHRAATDLTRRSLLLLAVFAFITAPAVLAQEQDAGMSSAETDGYRLDVGGYGSFRLDAHDADEGEPAFTLRRFVLTTDARLGARFQVYSEIEYERMAEIEIERAVERADGGLEFEQEVEGPGGSEIALEQAWAQYNLSDGFGVRFGAVLPPVGRFNLLHDDNLWNFPHRPLIDRAGQVLPAPGAWTEMGLGIVGVRDFDSGMRLSYQAYLLTGTTLDFAIEEKVVTRVPRRNKLELEAVVSPTQGAFDGSNAADAGAARLALSPTLGSEYAVSAYAGRYTPDFLDTDETLFTLGFDGRQRLGSFYVEGEFLYARYGGVDRVAEDFAAAAVDHATEVESDEAATLETEIAIELSGLADRRYGFWLDLGRPIALAPGTFGLPDALLTPVVRYERVWLKDTIAELDFAGGVVTELVREDVEQDRLSLGLAFRPVPQAVFHLTYVRSNPIKGALLYPEVDADEAVNAVAFGLAVGF